MIIRIENASGIDTIDTVNFKYKYWSSVYPYVQQILEMNGTTNRFFPPEGSTWWHGDKWLEYAASL